MSSAYQDAARGFERTDVTAIGRIGGQLLNAAFVLPVLFLGGGLMPVMTAATVASFLVLPLIMSFTHKIGVGKPSFDRRELAYLTRSGWAFLATSAAMTSLGFVDTITLSKLATPEVFGWNSAAQKLVGTLLVPSTALIASLYPTLSRLFVEDPEQYKVTLRRSISGTGLLAIPLALGCALYSDLGVAIYGKSGYAPAGQNLIVLSGMVLLVYFSMPLCSALQAAGRHVVWASALSSCVVLRMVLNLLLIPWFQKHYGNGGPGCVRVERAMRSRSSRRGAVHDSARRDQSHARQGAGQRRAGGHRDGSGGAVPAQRQPVARRAHRRGRLLLARFTWWAAST